MGVKSDASVKKWSWRIALGLSLFLLPCTVSASPRITVMPLRGLQRGATTTLTIEGSDLAPAPRILMSVPIAKQVVKEGATANKVAIEVTLDAAVAPGLYHLRLACDKGISGAVAVAVDDLLQSPVVSQIGQLPIALHGTVSGSGIVSSSFAGKAGDRIVVEVEARRLGSALDPILELYDEAGILLDWSQSKPSIAGDARIETTLPGDGQYRVELHDVLYRGGNPNHFRLKIGDLHYADLVYPMGAQRGTKADVAVIGGLPSALRAQVDLVVDAQSAVPLSMAEVPRFSGPAPQVLVGDFPEILETENATEAMQEVTVPAVLNGRIGAAGEEDRFRLRVEPGAKLRFDVLANRAGSPLDGVLQLHNEQGAQLAANDDRGNIADPGFDYTVPEEVNLVVLALSDLQGRGGPDFLYRIAVTPQDRPNFSLQLFEDRHHVPLAGATLLRVRANRGGYNGPIKLSVNGIPEGVTISEGEIPAGATDALLTLSGFGLRPAAGIISVTGRAREQDGLVRVAQLPADNVTRSQPWLRDDVGVAVTGPGMVGITWDTADPILPLGGKFEARVRVTRAAGAEGPIRLLLLTSQIVPQIAEGADRGKPDNNRALRFEPAATIAADQTAGVGSVVVPGDLAKIPYDVAIRAELLSADGKSVQATAVTRVRRLMVQGK